MLVPDDSSGSDDYQKEVMVKVRNIVVGGAVLAASLGVTSLGAGMGLTASQSSLAQAHSGLTVRGTESPGLNGCDPSSGICFLVKGYPQ